MSDLLSEVLLRVTKFKNVMLACAGSAVQQLKDFINQTLHCPVHWRKDKSSESTHFCQHLQGLRKDTVVYCMTTMDQKVWYYRQQTLL